jgi:peptidoglycan lytic transglycosylase
MVQTAGRIRVLASPTRLSPLWLLVIAGLLVLASPAASAPEIANPVSARPIAGKSAAESPATIKLAARRHAKARSHSRAKSHVKHKSRARSKAKSKRSRAKRATKPVAKRTLTKAVTVPLPIPRPAAGTTGAPSASAAVQPTLPTEIAVVPPIPPVVPKPQKIPPAATTIITTAAIDVAAVKRAIGLVRSHKQSDANEIKKDISDPVAKTLVEWVILRSDDSDADFARYAAFITANPNWPSIVTLRRKAEAMAWRERLDAAKVRVFFSRWQPLSAKGRLVYARALLALGDRNGAGAQVREAWRYGSFSQDVEKQVEDAFGEFLTRADYKARMDRRLYERDDTDAGLRMARHLGGNEPAIAKARIAMLRKSGSKALLDAVPAAARQDIGYKFARIQMLRRSDHLAAAVALMRTVPNALDKSHDLDAWWIERRLLARKLLDVGDAKDAYLVVRDATPPARENYRAEHQFLAGWIALRFLHDPATAYGHFKHVADGIDGPIARARGAYWMGRAAEAMKRPQQAKALYREAARYPTAYYGQIARAKAGLGELSLTPFPSLSSEQRARAAQVDVVRAAELLYAVDARDLAWTMMADLGDKSTDIGVLVMLAELTAKYKDARGMLLVGRLALARGYALDHAAFPTIGVPDYKPIGPPIEPAIVYSVVRQESWFNPKTVSSAHALGLMQVTPPAGRYIAKKFKVRFDRKRLLNDTVYNVQMGSAELGDVIRDYRGSYIMAFAAYNAGRGRVKEWVGRFGDPRKPNVDPIDWVERIPFSETRNYVQRVMENLQVYRVRFGGSSRLLIEADLRRGARAN